MISKTSPSTKTTKVPKPGAQRHRKTAVPVTAVESLAQNVSTADIARLAYSLWEARGCPGGSPEEDWFRAEQELLGKH
jgi:hypothetical protein